MKLVKIVGLTAIVVAVHAHAAITHTSAPLPEAYNGAGAIQPPTTFTLANPTQYNIASWGLDNYLRLWPGNSATIDLHGATSFSFGVGWRDDNNTVTIDGQTFLGKDLWNGKDYVTFTSDTPMYTVVFSEPSTSCCFEFGFATNWLGAGAPPVTAVPEPATYALFGAGLAVIGFAGRRRATARSARS